MKNILIYGFGRMGLTHYAILNQLLHKAKFTFIDPDKKIAFFAKNNIDINILSDDSHLDASCDYALICTPPMFHIDILKRCSGKGIPNIFVEKPFGGLNSDYSGIQNINSQVSIGYVLRFNPIVQWVKHNIKISMISAVEASYNSNTIEKKPKGWRNTNFSGVTNEVGSHIIDLCVYLFGLSQPTIMCKEVASIISDVDDIVKVELDDKQINYNFYFNWINIKYRKPIFRFKILLKDKTEWIFDQQKIEILRDQKVIKYISAVDLAPTVPYYLRGVDYTLQMQSFLSDRIEIASLEDALVTREIIKNLFK